MLADDELLAILIVARLQCTEERPMGIACSVQFQAAGYRRVRRATLSELECLLIDSFAGRSPARRDA